ncbi:MAG: cytosine/adenosine deaminase-related metal-dependent hydrolase [Planctomycetota bacterium]
MSTLFRAQQILPDAFRCIDNGGVLVEAGRIIALATDERAADDLSSLAGVDTIELGDCVLTPGLVNAHAHLELPALEATMDPQPGFVDWVGQVLRSRAECSQATYEATLDLGAARLLASGTTAVGDIDSTGVATARLGRWPLRARIYREFLDAGSKERRVSETQRLDAMTLGDSSGIAPHAPHTVSGELLAACAQLAGRNALPLSVHWAESAEEREWLGSGSGAFAAFLGESPGRSGLAQLMSAGVLDSRVSLVHANFPEVGDLRSVAQKGAVLVHCPGTHRYFDRAPVDLEEWLACGAMIALGTDSLASNDDLDLRLEMQRVRDDHPEISAESVFDWATRGGSWALGLEHEIGELLVGKSADIVAFDCIGAQGLNELLEGLTLSIPAIQAVWIAGEPV